MNVHSEGTIMKKHKTKMVAAAVIVVALVGAWFLTPSSPAASDDAPLIGEVLGYLADDEAVDEIVHEPNEPDVEDEDFQGNASPTGNPAYPHETPYADDSAYPQQPDAAEPSPVPDDSQPAYTNEDAAADYNPDSAHDEQTITEPDTPSTEDSLDIIQVHDEEHYNQEPEASEPVVSDEGSFTVTLTVRADILLNNMNLLDADKHELVPAGGIIFPPTPVTAYEGESVFNVLQREMRRERIHMASRFTPAYNSAYVEAINNIYVYDAGPLSGWMFSVNGYFPNFGSSLYILSPGDVIEWVYSLDLGRDLGTGLSR